MNSTATRGRRANQPRQSTGLFLLAILLGDARSSSSPQVGHNVRSGAPDAARGDLGAISSQADRGWRHCNSTRRPAGQVLVSHQPQLFAPLPQSTSEQFRLDRPNRPNQPNLDSIVRRNCCSARRLRAREKVEAVSNAPNAPKVSNRSLPGSGLAKAEILDTLPNGPNTPKVTKLSAPGGGLVEVEILDTLPNRPNTPKVTKVSRVGTGLVEAESPGAVADRPKLPNLTNLPKRPTSTARRSCDSAHAEPRP